MVVALSRGLNCTFCYSIIKGLPILYLEGLIHGGAYFRNFTVTLSFESMSLPAQ